MSKKENILEAAMSLFVEHGEQSTSMKCIAKRAECGIGTMYNYFPSKEKLINNLYLHIKIRYSNYILLALDNTKSIKYNILSTWRKTIGFALKYPAEIKFIELFCQSPIIEDEVKNAALSHFLPLFDIYEQGKADEIIKNIDTLQLITFVKGAVTASVISKPDMNSEEIEALTQMAWDAIKG